METLRIAAKIDHLTEVVSFVEKQADRLGLIADKKFCAILALEEAFVNICHYTYPEQEGMVELACGYARDFFVLELSDTGDSFDMLNISDPDLTAGVMERKIGGLGVHLIRTLSDNVSYQHQDGRNILRMEFAAHAI